MNCEEDVDDLDAASEGVFLSSLVSFLEDLKCFSTFHSVLFFSMHLTASSGVAMVTSPYSLAPEFLELTTLAFTTFPS